MKAVIDSAIPYVSGVLEPYAEVVYCEGSSFSPAEVADADVLIIRTRTRCDEHLLRGSKVRLIATATIGFDHIDLDYCAANGIEVVTAAGCNAAGVLQWVSATLALLSKQQGWHPSERRLGIVGVGNVGSLVEHYARRWGFDVVLCDPPRKEREGGDFISLEELLPQCDIVTLHTPLDATTLHLIDAERISLLKSGATLINASRGEVASTEALLSTDATLCLDVWEGEPNINLSLLDKALITTPHIAGYSAQGKANAAVAVVRATARHFGLPLEQWYPSEVQPVERRDIGWDEMCQSIVSHCDLVRESADLKSLYSDFESLRNNYTYREEYF
ncbi:MAG: 4-phosphoerythronate dehydrogenase [Alistipes sp.]|nr:4-phosphoerythronate dehydrogenase [Alistipes sp.]